MSGPTTEAIASARVAHRPGPLGLVFEGLGELLKRHRLIRYLVQADLKRTHADTIFGQLWWIFDPLLLMAVYVVLVTVIFKRPTPDYPLFLFAAILPWKWFATTLNDATLSVTGRESLIRQIQFPKIVLPTASVMAATLSFIFGLIALAIVYLFYLERLSIWIVFIPLIAVVQFLFTLAIAIVLAAINAFYRDVQNVMRHVVRLWFYLSPALYSIHDLEGGSHARRLLELNPFAPLFESYRAVTWGMAPPDWFGLLWVSVVSVVLLVIAVYVFKRLEPAFARIL